LSDPYIIRIDMACNDPDNGLFAGRVCQIALPDGLLELTANAWGVLSFRGCPKLVEKGSAIRLAGKQWPIIRSEEWVGNWCWNGYWMRDQAARQFLVWLHARGLFHCEAGELRLSNAWDQPLPLDLEPDREHPVGLGRLLVKAMLAEDRA
jgi:hypothetical protein